MGDRDLNETRRRRLQQTLVDLFLMELVYTDDWLEPYSPSTAPAAFTESKGAARDHHHQNAGETLAQPPESTWYRIDQEAS